MKAKSIGTVVLLAFVAVSVGYLIVSELRGPVGAEVKGAAAAAEPAGAGADSEARTEPDGVQLAAADAPAKEKVTAYYFHYTQRCMTCNKIERLAEETLREQFDAALGAGRVEWKALNIEEPANRHFADDFQLVTSSLVLVQEVGGEQRRWTNLEKVWDYVHEDEAAFKGYVAEQVRTLLDGR